MLCLDSYLGLEIMETWLGCSRKGPECSYQGAVGDRPLKKLCGSSEHPAALEECGIVSSKRAN